MALYAWTLAWPGLEGFVVCHKPGGEVGVEAGYSGRCRPEGRIGGNATPSAGMEAPQDDDCGLCHDVPLTDGADLVVPRIQKGVPPAVAGAPHPALPALQVLEAAALADPAPSWIPPPNAVSGSLRTVILLI